MCAQEHPPGVCQKSKMVATILWCEPLPFYCNSQQACICLQCNYENTNALFVLVACQLITHINRYKI